MVDEHGAVVLAPELLGKVEQELREPCRDVGEDEVGSRIVGASQPARQLRDQPGRDIDVGVHELVEDVAVQFAQRHRRHRVRRSRPGAAVEQGQLAEDLPGTENGQDVAGSRTRLLADLDLAGHDEVRGVTGRTLFEHCLALS